MRHPPGSAAIPVSRRACPSGCILGPPSRAAAPKSAIEMTGRIFQSFGSASLHACYLLYISSIANGPTLLSESLRFGHPGDAEVVFQVEHHCVPLA